jgi:hypothetical protein
LIRVFIGVPRGEFHLAARKALNDNLMDQVTAAKFVSPARLHALYLRACRNQLSAE